MFIILRKINLLMSFSNDFPYRSVFSVTLTGARTTKISYKFVISVGVSINQKSGHGFSFLTKTLMSNNSPPDSTLPVVEIAGNNESKTIDSDSITSSTNEKSKDKSKKSKGSEVAVETHQKEQSVPFLHLWKYATKFEILLNIIGLVFAAGAGGKLH